MRLHSVLRVAVLGVAMLAGAAAAQTRVAAAPRWSVDSGYTVGDGANVVRAEVAYPGLWLDFIHGLSPTFDIGARFAMNWGGPAGEINYCSSLGCGLSNFNFDFQLLLRTRIADFGNGLRLAGTCNPGVIIWTPDCHGTSCSWIGINLPVGVQLGIPFNDRLIFNASFELPMYLDFLSINGNSATNFTIPLMFGGGAEYQVLRQLLVTFKLAMGPSIPTHSNTSTSFALQALAGAAYKFN